MQEFPKKDNPLDFSNPVVQQAFVQDSRDSKSLLQKELDVIRAEQLLLKKRIKMIKNFINDLPASDPQYTMLIAQVQMDQVEIDGLGVRETLIIQKISV